VPLERSARTEARVHRLFLVSLLLKAVHSLVETFGGILLATLPQQAILRIASLLTQEELLEDPRDVVANYLCVALGVSPLIRNPPRPSFS
jgi:uncharacterized membrane protein